MQTGMTMPRFWRAGPVGVNFLISILLAPLGLIYASIVYCRLAVSRPAKIKPVLVCVGNAVVGGSGKTPVCLALGQHALEKGIKVHYLTRGYGGSLSGPVRVDLSCHDAKDVGDEALLLAAVAPTWVSRDRGAGARQAEAAGADLIIMDDGMQNPSVYKSYTVLVIDGSFGFGNGLPMPAGPLREFRGMALARSNRCMVIGPADDDLLQDIGATLSLSRAEVSPVDGLSHLTGKKLIAFAGIGHPEKFFDMLQNAGLHLSETLGFPDHYPYKEQDMTALVQKAKQDKAILVTTSKDFVRLPKEFQTDILSVPVELHLTGRTGWDSILDEAMAHG